MISSLPSTSSLNTNGRSEPETRRSRELSNEPARLGVSPHTGDSGYGHSRYVRHSLVIYITKEAQIELCTISVNTILRRMIREIADGGITC